MPTKKVSTKGTEKYAQQAATVAAFASDPNTPQMFREAIYEMCGLGSKMLGRFTLMEAGKGKTRIEIDALADFIKEVETRDLESDGHVLYEPDTDNDDEAARVIEFATDDRIPDVFRSVMFTFFAHATNATGIEIVVGPNCDTIDRAGLRQFIGRAFRLGYDERGLYKNEAPGEGDYLIKPEGERAPDSIEAFALHLSEVLRIGRSAEFVTSRLYNDIGNAWNDAINDVPRLDKLNESPDYIALALKTAARQRGKGGE
jgi:hypothetical protein